VTDKTTGGNLIATLKPANPKPGESVTISLTSFQVDLDAAPIEWLVNEDSVGSGIGLKEFTITAGATGEIGSVIAKVTKPDGGQIIKTITYLPASVNLVYSTDSYTPIFYAGHSLPSPGSKVKVTAITHFTNNNNEVVPANKLIYTWKTGTDTIIKASGLGKDSATITLGNLYEETTITVIVSDPATKTTVEQKLTLKTTDPKILIYRQDPLMGVLYNQAVGNDYQLADTEEVFRAEPYFFSLSDWLNDKLNFTWQINGKQVELGEGDKRLLSLSRPVEGNGNANIDVRVENQNNLFQNSSTNIRIKY
jgi:hypothetical protein